MGLWGQEIEIQQLSHFKESGHACVTSTPTVTLTARAGARVEVLVVIEVVSCRAFVVNRPSLSLKDTEVRVNRQG